MKLLYNQCVQNMTSKVDTIQGAKIPMDDSSGIHIGNAGLSINAFRGMAYVVC